MWQLQWGRLSRHQPRVSTGCDREMYENESQSVCACVCVCTQWWCWCWGVGGALVEGCHNEAWFGGTDVGIRRASVETRKWWFISMSLSLSLSRSACLLPCVFLSLSLPLLSPQLSLSLWYDFLCPEPLTEAILPHSAAMVHLWLTFNDSTITARHTHTRGGQCWLEMQALAMRWIDREVCALARPG